MKKSIFKKNFFKFILYILLAMILFLSALVVLCRLSIKSAAVTTYYQGCLSDAQNYDYILIPGAGLSGAKPGPQLQDRLDTAILLYEQGAAPKIIVSGAYDNDTGLYEPTVMRIYLSNRGVPETDIICDEHGIDTAETLRRSKAFDKEKKFLICTQSLYIERTAFLAEKFDLTIGIADSDIRIYTADVGKSRLRETFAATKAVFEGLFAKDCTYDVEEYPLIIGGVSDE